MGSRSKDLIVLFYLSMLHCNSGAIFKAYVSVYASKTGIL